MIVGLGNPGKDYADTRHNVGFRCINYLAKLHRIPLTQRQCRSLIGSGEIAGVPVVLAKPRTFMNSSGEAVKVLVQRFSVPIAGLVIIYDDLDLPVGKIRTREAGSSGGHKGIESIVSCLGSQDFSRIRVGIGRPEEKGQEAISYVLSPFSPAEKARVEEAIHQAAEAVRCILSEGVASAMNRFN